MDPIHVHLMLNHVPILGTLFCALLLGIGMTIRNRTVENTALVTLLIVALMTIPAFLSGEEAEHTVEQFQGFSEPELEEHEEHAELSLWLTEVSGILALLTLLAGWKYKKHIRLLSIATTVVCASAFASMVPLALHGGKIMHQELRESPVPMSDHAQED